MASAEGVVSITSPCGYFAGKATGLEIDVLIDLVSGILVGLVSGALEGLISGEVVGLGFFKGFLENSSKALVTDLLVVASFFVLPESELPEITLLVVVFIPLVVACELMVVAELLVGGTELLLVE